MVTLSQNGNRPAQIRYCGFMGNVSVRVSNAPIFAEMPISNSQLVRGKALFGMFIFLQLRKKNLCDWSSSTIVEDIFEMRKRGLASLAFFYCDFRDVNKKNLRGLLSSVLLQLCDHSDSYSNILSKFYSSHGDGSREPSDDELVGCLEDILRLPGQAPAYIIIDGLDECPDTFGMPSPREKVLVFLKGLVNYHVQNLHVCITSRPEVDIQSTINCLPFRSVSLHNESGQRQDIVNYVRSIVYTDAKLERWRPEDKELVIDVLTNKADGM